VRRRRVIDDDRARTKPDEGFASLSVKLSHLRKSKIESFVLFVVTLLCLSVYSPERSTACPFNANRIAVQNNSRANLHGCRRRRRATRVRSVPASNAMTAFGKRKAIARETGETVMGFGIMSSAGRRVLVASVSAFLLVACAVLVSSGGMLTSLRRDALLQSPQPALASTLPAIQKEVSDSLKQTFKVDVLKLSKKIEESLKNLDSVNLKGVDKTKVAQVLAQAKKAESDVKGAQDIATRARIAAAKSDAFLADAEKSKKNALARSTAAAKAAAAATAAAKALKVKLDKAAADSQRLSKAAKDAHAAYTVAKKIADILKSKADSTHKQAVAAALASKSAAASAAATKKAAAAAATALAAATKDSAVKSKQLAALNASVKQARAARDAAAVAASKALAEAERTKSLNSAKLAAAQKAAKAAEADLKVKIAAAAVASRLLRVAGQTRSVQQSAAVRADDAFSKAKTVLNKLQLKAATSKAAAHAAEVESLKAARLANSALKTFLARKQSDLTWPGKKPVLSA
jgi:hypothetical protein